MTLNNEVEGRNTLGKQNGWQHVKVPNECTLRIKESFEYTTPVNLYDLTAYGNQDGSWYAIALPRDGERVIIYGSNVMPTAQMAIQVVVDKIHREGLEGWSPGEEEDEADEDSDAARE